MSTKKTNVPVDKKQLWQLAVWTCQWWNAVFIQTQRFIESIENDKADYPWENDKMAFLAERQFLVYAIYNAVKCTKELNIIFKEKNEYTFDKVLNEIYKIAPWDSIKDLRDMNVHDIDYLLGQGRKQDSFVSSINLNEKRVATNPKLTIIMNNENGGFYIGNINLEQLIGVMKSSLPIIQDVTSRIFENTFYYSND